MVGGRNAVNERIRKGTMDRRALLRDIVKRVALRRNVSDKYPGNLNLKLTGAFGCARAGIPWPNPTSGKT
jgi:hypothetical protein